jgi:hypothetical protein
MEAKKKWFAVDTARTANTDKVKERRREMQGLEGDGCRTDARTPFA